MSARRSTLQIPVQAVDDALRLVPPRNLSLEDSLEFLADDELLEVTPKSIRIRKRILSNSQRAKERAKM
jgi:GTP-binding protein